MVELLRSEQELKSLGTAIADLVGAEYSTGHMVDASIEMYRGSLARAATGRGDA